MNKFLNIGIILTASILIIIGYKEYKQNHCTIKGKFFVVTKGGDVYPARMAAVTVFRDYEQSNLEPTKLTNYVTTIKDKPSNSDRQVYQLSALFVFAEILAFDKEHGNCAYTCKTNLDGLFELDNLPAGKYEVICFGRAGANKAIWMDFVDIDWMHSSANFESENTLASYLDI